MPVSKICALFFQNGGKWKVFDVFLEKKKKEGRITKTFPLLHQTTTSAAMCRRTRSCILSFFYIKPQPHLGYLRLLLGCILSFFYIKPQLLSLIISFGSVVSYLLSTSNHNMDVVLPDGFIVVSYLSSTSNHNRHAVGGQFFGLYLIFLLHPTTTGIGGAHRGYLLYLIFLLHQTTTGLDDFQQGFQLYLIFFLHQTTTIFSSSFSSRLLYLIFFLHQTTTCHRFDIICLGCILSSFYIKPQRRRRSQYQGHRCILSFFYIKPQPVSSFPLEIIKIHVKVQHKKWL